MPIRLILVVRDPETQKAYLKAFDVLDVVVDTVSSFKALYQALTQKTYNGVLVDLVTKIKSPRKDIDPLMGVMETFPLVQLRLDAESGQVKALYRGAETGGGLKDFIEKECIPFKPRKIRVSDRRKINLNVVFSPIEADRAKAAANPIRTVTLDVSAGGCFLITSEPLKAGQKVVMKIKELKDKSPIVAEVRWLRPWGHTMGIPGIGVRFLKISASQKYELLDMNPFFKK